MIHRKGDLGPRTWVYTVYHKPYIISYDIGIRYIRQVMDWTEIMNLSKFEVNEICWNNDGDYFFLTTGLGTLQVLSYPDVQKSSLKLFSQN